MSLNNPQNLENCLNKDFNRIKRRVSKIVTLLPENSLTPIPKKDIREGGLANKKDNKELKEAERTAVFIRRMEYATTMKRQMDKDKTVKDQAKKVALIQEWWKTMFKIIKIQKNIRGFFFRKNLMKNLEHQEKLLLFITEFDNIYNYHLLKQFMDNLKKKRDYEKSKLMEKCEDFNEKMDNLEKLRDLKNFKDCFQKWKNETKRKRKEALDNLVKKLDDILKKKNDEDKKEALNKMKDEQQKLNDKIKDLQANNAKKYFMKQIIRPYRLNKMLNNIKNKIDDENKKDAFEKLKNYNNFAKGLDKLKKVLENKMKKDAWNDMKTMDFVDKLDDLINKHNNKVVEDAKKELLDKLKDLNNKKLLKDKLKQWKDLNDELKNRMKILNKLKRHKSKELKKKEEEEKKKLVISSGINDFELISDKKHDDNNPFRKSQIFISAQNDINILAKPGPKYPLSHTAQNFSFIPSESTNFKFGDPVQASKKLDNDIINNQLNEIDSLLRNKLNNDEKEIRFNKILSNNLKKIDNGKILKEYFDRWRNATRQGKQDSLNNLAEKLNDILTKAKKESDDQLKKDALNNLKSLDDSKPKKDINKLINSIQKYVGDLKKAVDILEKIINNKLKDDTFKKLKTMDFVDILKKFKKKHDDKDKDTKLKKIMNNLKKLRKESEDNDKDKINLKKYFDKLKNQTDRDKFLEKFKDLVNKENNVKKFKNTKVILRLIKPDEKTNNQNSNPEYKSKRIAHRGSPKKNKNRNKSKNRINRNKKLLKKAFNKWKNMASFYPTKRVLDQIKNNKLLNDNLNNKNYKNSLFPKYKKKVLKVLFNIYKTNRNSLLKKYFDIWRKATKIDDDQEKNRKNIPKYKKKPKILANENPLLDKYSVDKESFRPKHYNHKTNLYSKRPLYLPINNQNNQNESMNLNEEYKPYIRHYNKMPNYRTQQKLLWPFANFYTNKYNKNVPYYKKFIKRTLDYEQPSYPSNQSQDDYINNYDDNCQRYYTIWPKENHNEIKEGDENNNKNDNEQNYYGYFQRFNDNEICPNNNLNINIEENNGETSSYNESLLNGMLLIENRKSIRLPRDYTSQSFFIDKNAVNDYKNDYSTNNQLPMTMKGDFVSLIEQNPKIMNQKNPRIQVTNAAVDLSQIINDDNNDNELNTETINDEIDKLENSYLINENKVLNKVIQNCDKDVYSSRKPFYSKKDQWYSVSIPLKDNEAKWEFLNNIRGERDRNTLNKFELIQKAIDPSQKEEKKLKKTFNSQTFKPINLRKRSTKNIQDKSYKLQEMNYSQFYKTPVQSAKDIFEDEKADRSFNVIRIPRMKKRVRGSPSCLSISYINDKNNNNYMKSCSTDRTRGKFDNDPTINTIE